MESVPDFLSSLKQRQLVSLAESALASEPVEIPTELLIAANCDLRVFPVVGCSRFAVTKAAIETATSDLSLIGYWIRHHGDPINWHAATGASLGDGVVALEVHDEGRMALCQLCQDDWDWIDTLRSQTGDGTRYLFFRWPAGMAMCRSAKQLAPGLALHGEGDSVPVPPSRTSSGIVHAYLTPSHAAIADAPAWLIRTAFHGGTAVVDSEVESVFEWNHGSAA